MCDQHDKQFRDFSFCWLFFCYIFKFNIFGSSHGSIPGAPGHQLLELLIPWDRRKPDTKRTGVDLTIYEQQMLVSLIPRKIQWSGTHISYRGSRPTKAFTSLHFSKDSALEKCHWTIGIYLQFQKTHVVVTSSIFSPKTSGTAHEMEVEDGSKTRRHTISTWVANVQRSSCRNLWWTWTVWHGHFEPKELLRWCDLVLLTWVVHRLWHVRNPRCLATNGP